MAASIHKLHIGSRTLYVRATTTQLREAMSAYIRAERAKGVPLADIMYTWVPITVSPLPRT